YLRAIEEEQFDILPSPTYVKGFIRTYADYLGLDGQLYVDEYNSRFVSGDDWSPRSASRAASRQQERRVQRNVVMLAIGAILVLTVVVISAWKASDNGQPVVQNPPTRHVARHRATAPAAYLEITAVK